jgi:hypothetical protein
MVRIGFFSRATDGSTASSVDGFVISISPIWLSSPYSSQLGFLSGAMCKKFALVEKLAKLYITAEIDKSTHRSASPLPSADQKSIETTAR